MEKTNPPEDVKNRNIWVLRLTVPAEGIPKKKKNIESCCLKGFQLFVQIKKGIEILCEAMGSAAQRASL